MARLLSLVVHIANPRASAQLVSTGMSVTLNGASYYISPFSAGNVLIGNPTSFSTLPGVYGFKPVTVVQDSVSVDDLSTLLTNWSAVDDVFQPSFAQAILLGGDDVSPIDKKSILPNVESMIEPLNNSAVPSGPYFLEMATGSVYPVYRLYSDFSGAFSQSLLQKPDGTFQTLSAQIPGLASLAIGVPSRLYYKKTPEKPLAGVRIGIKDIFALAGVKRSNGNRAYYNLYPPSNVTGTAVARLISAGAQIVGLQKPSQFANGESATSDWVDFHAPFNPRADGYQSPGSSSSGAAASIASYEWLDIALGSDTGGSIRSPSAVQGLFGNRPSYGSVPLDNVTPLSPVLDTAGFITRDPYLWDDASQVLYDTSFTSATPSYPRRIYTIGFPSSSLSSAAAPLLIKFIDSLASLTDGDVTALDIPGQWTASSPEEAKGIPLIQLMNITYPVLISKHQTELVQKPFYADYATAFDGRRPFVNPAPLARWAFADELSDSILDDAIKNKTIFMDWFQTKILPRAANPDQCSDAVLVYISNTGLQSPRNQYSSGPSSAPTGFPTIRLSSMSECPDFVFPLGEVASFSAISNHSEFFPVTVNLMAAKGCDGILFKLAQDLLKAGVLAKPMVGRTLAGDAILP
ncbi:glutamyl-tRNA amidotransferase [Thozetella sp. PMI_491]|nr:glutamyl-tRNA amidotransferase [Thozetella sp. PMI_491]